MTLPIAYPDQELVVLDLLSMLGTATTWLPPDPTPPLFHVQRIGGGADEWDITDYALIRIAAYGNTRNDAWALSKEAERMILGHRQKTVERPGKPSDGMFIDYTALDVGGLLDPDLDPDDRRVITNYTIGMRRQYHLLGV